MVVNVHVHIKGGDKYSREFPPELTVKQMDEAEVDKAVTFSICLPSRESNLSTKRAASTFLGRLIPFYHPPVEMVKIKILHLPPEGEAKILGRSIARLLGL